MLLSKCGSLIRRATACNGRCLLFESIVQDLRFSHEVVQRSVTGRWSNNAGPFLICKPRIDLAT